MSKKLIIMIAAAGLVSFGGAFVFAWLTKPAPSTQSDELDRPTLASMEALKPPWPEAGTMPISGDSKIKKAMTEKQLKNLVYEIRESINKYNNKMKGLDVREKRLQMVQDELKKDIEKLNNLRIEVAAMVARLKSERDKLLKDRVEITQTEKANLMKNAKAFDVMDESSASKILTNMCASGDPKAEKRVFGGKGSNIDDAVKTLHYMTERKKAKVLAELASSEPRLAAFLVQQLKRIAEVK